MRIIHVIFSFQTGGAETMLIDIVNEQVKHEDVSLIIVNKRFNDYLLSKISEDVKVYFINRKPDSRNLMPIIKLNLLLYRLKPNFIHCHNANMIRLLFMNKILKTAIGLTVHDIDVPIKNFKFLDILFSISKAVEKDIYDRSGLNSVVVDNGINISAIKNNKNRMSEVFHIIQVSRLDHDKKGQDILIKSIDIIVNKLSIKNIMVDLIGEGKSENYLKEMVAECNLTKNVKFWGLQTREYIYQHLSNYDLFIQPSRYEGFGLTVVEAMAAKLPVLVSNIHGPMEIINNGEFGYSFESENVEDLVDKIIKIKNSKPEEIEKLVNKAYDHVLNFYDISKTAKKYLYCYKHYAKPENITKLQT